MFSFSRAFSYTLRETLELGRDPVRLVMATFGTLILMLIMGYGITMDVNDLRYAVLDRDQTMLSRNYALNISGSRYFIEKPPILDYADLDQRMRSGELSLAMEIPPASEGICNAEPGCRSVPGSTGPCPRGRKRSGGMFRACTRIGWEKSSGPASVWRR